MKMKLSEAIRAGAKLGPQVQDQLFGDDGGSCALGAAIMGAGLARSRLVLEEYWSILDEVETNPSSKKQGFVRDIITILNDCCYWSREAIAEWVETIENKKEKKEVSDVGKTDVGGGAVPSWQPDSEVFIMPEGAGQLVHSDLAHAAVV